MDDLEVLKKARQLISDKDRWVKRATQKGNRYCAIGACARVSMKTVSSNASYIRELISSVVDKLDESASYLTKGRHCRIEIFNDAPGVTHPMLLAAFDLAICREEQSIRGKEKTNLGLPSCVE